MVASSFSEGTFKGGTTTRLVDQDTYGFNWRAETLCVRFPILHESNLTLPTLHISLFLFSVYPPPQQQSNDHRRKIEQIMGGGIGLTYCTLGEVWHHVDGNLVLHYLVASCPGEIG